QVERNQPHRPMKSFCRFGSRRSQAVLTTGVVLAVLLLPYTVRADTLACDVPDELMQFDHKLLPLAERLPPSEPVKIVGIGGASTPGLAAGSSDLAYPHRLQEVLARSYTSRIAVVNRGVPRQTARQMLERFPTDVIPEDPVLVIWETGTTDAVRGVDVD